MTLIVGLLGGAGTGKSSVASYLVDKYGAVRHSFAAPLKEIVRRAFDLRPEQVYGTQAEKEAKDPRYGVSARWLLQRIGTEGCRAVLGSDVWIRACLRGIADAAESSSLANTGRGRYVAVIDDVRFENEAHAIKWYNGHAHTGRPDSRFVSEQGIVLRLHRPAGMAANTAADVTHASEADVERIAADADIQPAELGLPALFAEVDQAMLRLGVTL